MSRGYGKCHSAHLPDGQFPYGRYQEFRFNWYWIISQVICLIFIKSVLANESTYLNNDFLNKLIRLIECNVNKFTDNPSGSG